MLNHVGQELKVIDVADEIQSVHPRQTDEYVLEESESGKKGGGGGGGDHLVIETQLIMIIITCTHLTRWTRCCVEGQQ